MLCDVSLVYQMKEDRGCPPFSLLWKPMEEHLITMGVTVSAWVSAAVVYGELGPGPVTLAISLIELHETAVKYLRLSRQSL